MLRTDMGRPAEIAEIARSCRQALLVRGHGLDGACYTPVLPNMSDAVCPRYATRCNVARCTLYFLLVYS